MVSVHRFALAYQIGEAVKSLHGFRLSGGDGVCINVSGGAGLGVAHLFGNGNQRHPVSNHQGGVGVLLWHNKDKSKTPCGATGWRFVFILFPLKNGPKMGPAGGGEKAGLHFKDKFS